MTDKGNKKGLAVVKLYGPYTKEDKKDNVVMITKCKQYDAKFVTILAESIVILLISVFMNCETITEISKETVKGDVLNVKEKNIKIFPRYERTHHKNAPSEGGCRKHCIKRIQSR